MARGLDKEESIPRVPPRRNPFREEIRDKEEVEAKREKEVLPNGAQIWRKQGVLHREDGPAVIRPDGTKKWFFKGKLHREDGPAVIRPPGPVVAKPLTGGRGQGVEVFASFADLLAKRRDRPLLVEEYIVPRFVWRLVASGQHLLFADRLTQAAD